MTLEGYLENSTPQLNSKCGAFFVLFSAQTCAFWEFVLKAESRLQAKGTIPVLVL